MLSYLHIESTGDKPGTDFDINKSYKYWDLDKKFNKIPITHISTMGTHHYLTEHYWGLIQGL